GGASASPQLLAPFDGVVAAAPAAQGDRLAAGAAVVQLGRSDPLRVLLAIEPSSSGALRTGMPVTLSAVQGGTPGNARAGAGAISASIAELQNVVDPKTQMAGAVLLLPAARQAGLLPGMRVYATIELGRREAWAVPRQAVLSDDKGAYLFQVAKDTAHRIDVNKLVDTGAQFGVEGPLDAALPVVVLGNYELKDGMAVRGGGR
ncbi:MAG TPA: HlyD family efflux transporter periplasmic adaptor subunit, partial [Janthinobacterium sp.]|nr:HlyD family efflux transporter periplasmic adaptor subunit [Janthinobacterium sp.]